MKIVTRFAALFFVIACVALLLASWFAAKREVRRAEGRIGDDVGAFADVLERSIVLAETNGGLAASVRLVEEASARSPSIEARFVAGGRDEHAGSSIDDVHDGRVLRHVRLVRNEGRVLGVLEISHGLPTQSAILRAALAEEVVFALGLGVLTGVLALALGHVLIGAPLARVVAQARRIASEDFSDRLAEDRTDEIGFLKRELNAMCDKLDLARSRLESEATAHVETLEQLRHLDRLRTVGTLASAVAHELGTPFNVVLLRAESMLDSSASDSERADAARVIIAQVEKMSRTVRQLLDFSRDGEAKKASLSVGNLLNEVVRLLGPLAKKNGVSLRAETTSDVTLVVDALRLEQLVTNLVMNAVAASPAGSDVTMRVGLESDALRPTSTERVDVVRIDVIDEGHGLDAAGLARIFEPFYTTKPEGGTGLGLTVATGIAEEHGGWLSAKSEVGHGSTFSVYLPACG